MIDHYEFFLDENNIQPEAILLTHDHGDHIAAVASLKQKYQIPVFAYFRHYYGQAIDYIVCSDENLVFNTAQCKVITCPGHIASHVSFYFSHEAMLFCGDTIFAAGVGNVKDSTASANVLYESILKLKQLPNKTKLYPAHDYFENNLAFAQSIAPQDPLYKLWAAKVDKVLPEDKPITTIADEYEMNIFFRIDEPELQTILHQKNKQVINAKTAFCDLRARKDDF